MNELLRAILGGTYTRAQLSAFVQKCYALALPAIRKKIALGKINLDLIPLGEQDIVYDCIADLFARDKDLKFPQLIAYFSKHLADTGEPSDALLTMLLRRLVLGKINQNIIRLYAESDPALGKILRNLKLGIERTRLFDQVDHFGETCLVPRDVDLLLFARPMPSDLIRRRFLESVLVHNTVPEMLTRLHDILVSQNDYQRTVTLAEIALLIKEIYAVGNNDVQSQTAEFEQQGEQDDIAKVALRVCTWLDAEKRSAYVGKGKTTDFLFDIYLLAICDILRLHFGDGQVEEHSYFELLGRRLPDLTREQYEEHHRTILEYLAKLGKLHMQTELSK